MHKDSYLLPRIDDAREHIASRITQRGSTCLTYEAGRTRPDVWPKTAFSIGQGLWQFQRVPFGLCSAPATLDAMERVQLGTFLGLATYYSHFVKDFATIASPLNELTKKNQPFHWEAEHTHAFTKLRWALISLPILEYVACGDSLFWTQTWVT